MTTLYKKIGRRYVPCAEHDPEVMDSLPQGSWLVRVEKGWVRRRRVEPNHAALAAASMAFEDRISELVRQASDMRPSQTPLTEEQRRAWRRLAQAFGEREITLFWPSAREAAEQVSKSLAEEAYKMMQNPMVRQAYDEFVMICRLSLDNQDPKDI